MSFHMGCYQKVWLRNICLRKNIYENSVRVKTVDYEPRPLPKIKILGTDASAVNTGSLLSKLQANGFLSRENSMSALSILPQEKAQS